VCVLFYDRRGDRDNLLADVTLARSTDGGRTFANYSWSTAPSDPTHACLGDYIGLEALGARVWAAWTEEAALEFTPGPPGDDFPSGPATIRVGAADFS
jgi:hypothetical protein